MGWYRTCHICGTEGKWELFCNCMDDRSEQLKRQISGMTLVRMVRVSGPYDIGHSYEVWTDAIGTTVTVQHNRFIGGEYGSCVEYEPVEDLAESIEIDRKHNDIEEMSAPFKPEISGVGF